jgi:hypothetical protein
MRRLTFSLLMALLLAPIGVTSSDPDVLINSGDSLFEIYEYEEGTREQLEYCLNLPASGPLGIKH